MTKTEIVEKIKEKTDSYIWANEIDAYIEGFLDALCYTYEITWDERMEIEKILNNTEEIGEIV